MKETLRKFISGFQMLTPKEVDLIVERTTTRAFKKGTILLEEGQIAKHCYLVLKGCVREYYLIDGEEKSTAFYTEGQPVNSFTSFTTDKPSRHYLVCAEDCELTVGTQAMEQAMCALIPRLEHIIRQEVERNAGIAQDEHARFITSTPEQRYLDLLEKRPGLLQRVPQHQIASYLGITPESLSRIRKRILQEKN